MSSNTNSLEGRRPLIVRRRRPEDSLVASLQRAGAVPLEIPVMRMASADTGSQQVLDAVMDEPERFSVAVFTSPHAAQRALQVFDNRLPARWRCLAVGQATAAVLRLRGLEVSAPDRDMTSEGVLALSDLPPLEGAQVVIFRGEGGRRVMDSEFAARGAAVTSCPLYRRVADTSHRDQLIQATDENDYDALIIHSGELLDYLVGILPRSTLLRMAEIPWVVPVAHLAERARQIGARRIEVAENASSAAIVSALTRCYS